LKRFVAALEFNWREMRVMGHTRILKSVGYASLLAAALLAFPTISHADYIFQITSDHCTNGCGASTSTPAGQVVVSDLGSGTLDFTVTLATGVKLLNTGAGGGLTVGFNLAGSPLITYSNLTANWLIPGGISPDQNAGSYHMDGAGDFQYGVLWGDSGGGSGTTGPLNFDITAAGLTLASLATNGSQYFAFDVAGVTGNTGIVDASSFTVSTVPEPSALLLVGTALLVIGYSVRNRIFSRTKEDLAVS
jgi:hypothetical protein